MGTREGREGKGRRPQKAQVIEMPTVPEGYAPVTCRACSTTILVPTFPPRRGVVAPMVEKTPAVECPCGAVYQRQRDPWSGGAGYVYRIDK